MAASGRKINLAVKVLWKIIRQIKGSTFVIQIISFNFADIPKRAGIPAKNVRQNLTF
jgi:hypothetical protein